MVTSNIPAGLIVPKQEPLDSKRYFASILELADLGTNDNKAFTYYEGMTAELNTGVWYVWREVGVGEVGLGVIANDFTYPANVISNGITYSNRVFNFFLKTIVTQNLEIENVGGEAEIYKDDSLTVDTKTFNLRSLKMSSDAPDGEEIHLPIDNTTDVDVLDFKFKKIKTNNLVVSTDGDNLVIDAPATFNGTQYYVNTLAPEAEELGTPGKPFRSLDNCIDRILNRGAFYDPLENIISPSLVGVEYEPYADRLAPIVVVIQSPVNVTQNLAINKVTYKLDGFDKGAALQAEVGAGLLYLLDMSILVDNIPKTGPNSTLPYQLDCAVIGQGYINNYSSNRLGYVKAKGFSNGTADSFDSVFYLGDTTSDLRFSMRKKSGLTYTALTNADNTTPLTKDGKPMTGYVPSGVPDYGAIEAREKNSIYGESLFLNGNLVIECFEQHLLYAVNAQVYGESGQLYFRRSYIDVNYSTKDTAVVLTASPLSTASFYKPTTYVYDIYMKDGSQLSYGGKIYTQENAVAEQGGVEAFACIHSLVESNKSNIALTGTGVVANLLYNHIFKIINNSDFTIFNTGVFRITGFNITSTSFVNLINIVNELGADFITTRIDPLILTDTFIKNKFYSGERVIDFINNPTCINTTVFIDTVATLLSNSIFSPKLISCTDDTDAATKGIPLYGQYIKDTTKALTLRTT